MSTENQYDVFSQMTLEELTEQEKCAMRELGSSSEFLAKEARRDLHLIRDVMRNVHNYNWLTKKLRAS